MTYWQTLAGNHPLPILLAKDVQPPLPQVVIDFIQAPTWSESKCFLEAHPELLQPEIDVLLQKFVTRQERGDVHEAIEEYRFLLAQRRTYQGNCLDVWQQSCGEKC